MPDASLEQLIEVRVHSRYLKEQSEPAQHRFAFSYTVVIRNHSAEAVRLLARYWRVTDGNNQVEEVRGPGVIGQTPLILPGSSFRYTSGAVLATAVGTMEGSYDMVTAGGHPFGVPIPLFKLVCPGVVH
ncbi:MAG: Co2+/Mg2+ efflux protein ApaG [Spongiibacteraceae bacterium]|jgi:ApaG protein|nr:Co2+/Mg2+ efflux protein ApaG [Spongiibacteraceae bacterium]